MTTKVLKNTNIKHVLDVSSGSYTSGDFTTIDPEGRTVIIEVKSSSRGAFSSVLKKKKIASRIAPARSGLKVAEY